MTVPMKTPPSPDIMELLLLKGDLGKLTADERVQYYQAVCKSIGLNPLTKPFEYITLNGKLQLYALRACTDQLRKINNISLEIVSRDVADDILTVHVRARDADGRVDEDLGSVAFPSALKGEARANTELKCVTKAKRRATLSICGLGWLDETEVADIPQSPRQPPKPAPDLIAATPHDPKTGEIDDRTNVREQTIEPEPNPDFGKAPMPVGQDTVTSEPAAGIGVKDMAREAAMRGREVMRQFYLSRSKAERAEIDKIRPELDDLVDAADKDEGEGS